MLNQEVYDAYKEIVGEEYFSPEDCEEAYMGEKYNNSEDFVQTLFEEIYPEVLSGLPPFIHIDWEATRRDVMMDYSEHNGFYFRNL